MAGAQHLWLQTQTEENNVQLTQTTTTQPGPHKSASHSPSRHISITLCGTMQLTSDTLVLVTTGQLRLRVQRSTMLFWTITQHITIVQGKLEHRRVKWYYARTNKHHHAKQIAHHVHLEAWIHKKAALIEQNMCEYVAPTKAPQALPGCHVHHDSMSPLLLSS